MGVNGLRGCLSTDGGVKVVTKLGSRFIRRSISNVGLGDSILAANGDFLPIRGEAHPPELYEGYVYILRYQEPKGKMHTLRVTPAQTVLTRLGWIPAGRLAPKGQEIAFTSTAPGREPGVSYVPIVLIKEYSMVRDRVWGLSTAKGSGYSANGFFVGGSWKKEHRRKR